MNQPFAIFVFFCNYFSTTTIQIVLCVRSIRSALITELDNALCIYYLRLISPSDYLISPSVPLSLLYSGLPLRCSISPLSSHCYELSTLVCC